jgi:endonuclease/exonuclease/phosphatase family metal-dependent hydrolase
LNLKTEKKMKKTFKKITVTLLCLIAAAVLIVGGYIGYLLLQYERIPDNTALDVSNQQAGVLATDTAYTALTYNIGFGAYNHDFSFFMDSGTMLDGTEVTGGYSRAQSEEIVQTNVGGAISIMQAENADFYLLQEVDVKATRSFKINESTMITDAFSGYASVYASNFHSAYLFYPFSEPHGSVEAGLLTLSRYSISGAVRRSYPVDESFPTKFFDLDRCFSLLRIPVEGGKELVLINTHLSAYDEGGLIRAAQFQLLNTVLEEEAQKGNYVIVGGDFNHALCGTIETFACQQQIPGWVYAIDESILADGYTIVCAQNVTETQTCRSTDIAYVKGVNYTAVLDGFIVSSNVEASAWNIDTDFEFSDHNPVKLTFILK